MKCGQCINCYRQTNCEKCVNCIAKVEPCMRRLCVHSGLIPNIIQNVQLGGPGSPQQLEEKKIKKEPKKVGRPRKTAEEKIKLKQTKPKQPTKTVKRPRVKKESQSEIISHEEEKEARHCFGPQCQNAARPSSKYCSDECGQALARKRLAILLPQRVQDYYGQTPAWKVEVEEKIQKLRKVQVETEEALKKVDDCAQNLDLYYGTLASGKPCKVRKSTNTEEEGSFYHGCMICGMEVPVKTLSKHIQRCFVRTEKQSTFGTAQRFGINPHNIVCEKYDKQTKTYCKRLRVICSEHYRDDIGSKFKLCGYPLAWTRMDSRSLDDIFLNMDILADGMCMNERKNCEQHTMWEQAASAVIENQRMQLLLKMDEIADHYRRLAESHSSQCNAITLLMNYRKQHSELPKDLTKKVGPTKKVVVYKNKDQEMPIDVDSLEDDVHNNFINLDV